jgi:hypothetical protein
VGKSSGRAVALFAWLVWGLSVALVVPAVPLHLAGPRLGGVVVSVLEVLVTTVLVLALSTVGRLIAARQPDNRVGWILLTAGVAMAAAFSTGGYVEFSIAEPPGRLPGTEWMAWVAQWILVLGLGQALVFLPLMFPNGRLLSRRWRPVGWLAAVTLAAVGLTLAFAPGKLEEYPGLDNPLGIGVFGGGLWDLLNGVGWVLFLTSGVLSAASVVVRFRHARGVERQQLKWFASAGALVAFGAIAVGAGYAFSGDPSTDAPTSLTVARLLMLASLSGLPIAVGVSILRYRLYDLDVIINRTLVYGALTAMLAMMYFGTVVILQEVFRVLTGQESSLVIVASTLLIAALFNPLRHRIQSFIDRRFYRRKYDAAKTLAAFNCRLRDETDLDTLTDNLAGVVRETMQPAHVSIWLRPDTAPKKDGTPG